MDINGLYSVISCYIPFSDPNPEAYALLEKNFKWNAAIVPSFGTPNNPAVSSPVMMFHHQMIPMGNRWETDGWWFEALWKIMDWKSVGMMNFPIHYEK